MRPAKRLCLFFMLFIAVAAASAQPPRNNGKNTPAPKAKLPKLTTSLGTRSDSATVSVDEALQLVGLPLTITDDKKQSYTITTYQFLYKRKGVTEDEETGKVSPATSMVAKQFKTTPLEKLWINIMREQLQAGEEFYFFDVVVKDGQGRLMFAPNLKIKIQ